MGDILKALLDFKNLYLNQIDATRFHNLSDVSYFISQFFLFIILLSVFHSIIIYICANLRNSYKFYKGILISTFYALAVSFSFGKIFQSLFSIFLGYIPFGGNEMILFNLYSTLTICYIFEILLVNNRLKALFERNKIGSEPIGSDIFLGVTVATLSTILLFFFVN